MTDTEAPDDTKKIEMKGRPRKKQPDNEEPEEPKEKAKRGRPKKDVVKGYDKEYFKRYYLEKRRVDCECSNCDMKFRTLNALKQHKQSNKDCLIKRLLKQVKEFSDKNTDSSDGVLTPEEGQVVVMHDESESPYNETRDERMIFKI